MATLKHYPGMPEEYINRKLTERVNAVENSAVLFELVGGIPQITESQARAAVAAVTGTASGYTAPFPSGGDDTTALQNLLNTASAAGIASGKQVRVDLQTNQVYRVSGLTHPSHVHLNGNGSTLLKTAGYSGSWLTSATNCVIRAMIAKTEDSWYGVSKYMRLSNIVLDTNNKNSLAGAEYLNVEYFVYDDVTVQHGQWSTNWATRIGGRNILIINPTILGGTKVFQDALHILYGKDIFVCGGYVESGDDSLALGDDQLTTTLYMEDEGLSNVQVNGLQTLSTRGFAVKVYAPFPAPFSSAPDNYTKTGRVTGVDISVMGRTGVLRNGGVGIYNTATPDNRNLSRLRGIKVHADLDIGLDNTRVYSAIPGVLLGNPTAVTAATPPVVTLAGHGLTGGEVVTFVDIPGEGMHNLGSFYQVMPSGLTANNFGLSDNAYRSNIPLPGSGFAAWTSGKLIKCSVGTGYTVGDILTLAGGTAKYRAKFRVIQVGPNGEVEAVVPVDRGRYSVQPPTPNTPTGGTGTGAILHLELNHDGVNAYATHVVGASDSVVTGTHNITDPTTGTKRFAKGYLVDCQGITCATNTPVLPGNGGVWVLNEASTLKTKYNFISGYSSYGPNSPTSIGAVHLYQALDTTISGTIDGAITNASVVTFAFAGNVGGQRTIASITSDDPARFASTLPTSVGEYVVISGNVLSNGATLDGIYTVKQVLDATTITLMTLDGDNLALSAFGASLGVTTPGSIALANNTAICKNLVVKKAAGATGVNAIGAASATPLRGTSIVVEDCDFSATDTPIMSTVAAFPLVSVKRVRGLTAENKTYRSTTITPNLLIGNKCSFFLLNNAGNTATIAAPINAHKGDVLEIDGKQPSPSPVTMAWDAIYKKSADPTPTAGGKFFTRFKFDGTHWVQQGGAFVYYT